MLQTEVCFAHFGQAEARTSGSHSSPQDTAEISFLLYTLEGVSEPVSSEGFYVRAIPLPFLI